MVLLVFKNNENLGRFNDISEVLNIKLFSLAFSYSQNTELLDRFGFLWSFEY